MMNNTNSLLPLFALITPLIGAVLILIAGSKRPRLREFWTIAASLVMFSLVFSMLPHIRQGTVLECRIIDLFKGVSLLLRVDSFGMIFALLASFLWIIVSIYAIGYTRGLNEHAQTRFFFCFAGALFGAVGVALSGNLLTLYMFYEILTVSTFPLVAHKETEESMRAGRKYLAYLLTGASFVLFSMGFTYYLTGTLDFAAGGIVQGKGSREALRLIFIAFAIGFGTKAAIMPLHEWLPSAMIAPTPVSALLHAVAVVKAGVFCVLRIVLYVFGPDVMKELNIWIVFAYIASFTVIFANIVAITQDNLKRRLAFSTINNLSIIILGAVLLATESVRGALLLIPFHGFMKITLFMCAGAIYVKTHKELISEMDGIGRQMPVTLSAFAIGAAGLVGIPPVCGFVGKWYLCIGAMHTKELIFLFVFLISALLDAIYFFPIVYRAFFRGERDEFSTIKEASPAMVAPLAITAIFSVLLGIFPDFFLGFFTLADIAVKNIFGGL